MRGNIHSLQSLGTVDGPGVRFVVFMQGCPLRCGYCHNPDTWEPQGGTPMEAAELLEKIRRCKPYFGAEGGVTVSGGEALLQPEFVAELFTRCHAEGIKTALDTSGCLLNDKIEKLLDVTDLVLLDIKMTTEVEYRRWIGGSLAAPLAFLHRLNERGIATWIRQVIVPSVNDSAANISRLNVLLSGYSCIKKVELLPFHKICATKYEAMGIAFPFDCYPAATAEQVAALQTLVEKQA